MGRGGQADTFPACLDPCRLTIVSSSFGPRRQTARTCCTRQYHQSGGCTEEGDEPDPSRRCLWEGPVDESAFAQPSYPPTNPIINLARRSRSVHSRRGITGTRADVRCKY